VNVDSDVPLVRDDRLAPVDAHAHLDGPACERGATGLCGGHRVSCPGERHDESVALRVHLDAAVRREGFAERAPVLGEDLRIPSAVFLEKSGRSLDVREQEGDRGRWGDCGLSRRDHRRREGGGRFIAALRYSVRPVRGGPGIVCGVRCGNAVNACQAALSAVGPPACPGAKVLPIVLLMRIDGRLNP
jgi:hypothetical protein